MVSKSPDFECSNALIKLSIKVVEKYGGHNWHC